MQEHSYQIKLEHFEGTFDLLLFFIERDELDIYDIPITKIINDFLDYGHQQEQLNIELSSEFILFTATLIRIKAKLLLPRKELDEAGNEIDPRQALVDKILEYKQFKTVAVDLAALEAIRNKMFQRGNVATTLSEIGEQASEGSEIEALSLFKLMKTFEKIMQKLKDRADKPTHTVVQYNYTMEATKEFLISHIQKEKQMPFEKIFDYCKDKMQAIFMFLSLLELAQQQTLQLVVGLGKNNFIIEWNQTANHNLN